MNSKLLAGAVFGLSLMAATQAQAALVYGEFVGWDNLTGDRSTDEEPGGLAGYGAYEGTGFQIGWDITWEGGYWHYAYTFTGLEKSISHLVIDVTNTCLDDPACVSNMTTNSDEDVTNYFYFDGDGVDGGVKFDFGGGEDFTVEFDSNRYPVWGDLAVKDGGGDGVCPEPGTTNAVCNLGMYDHNIEDILAFIATPDSELIPPTGIPVPAAVWLFGSGLLGMVGVARRRKTA